MQQHITIPNVARRIQYVADGGVGPLIIPFPWFDDADIMVYAGDVQQQLGVDYVLAGAGQSSGGSLTWEAGRQPVSGTTVTIASRLAIQRVTDLQQSGVVRAKDLNDDLDRITVALQDIAAAAAMALRMKITDTAGGLEIPEQNVRANKHLAFDGLGQIMLTSDAPQSDIRFTDPPITLVNGQSAYGLPAEVQSGLDERNYRVVIVNGPELVRGADFTVEADTLTLAAAPTTANKLAGKQVVVELVRPAINAAALAERSVTGPKIALGAVKGEHFGFPGSARGDMLIYDGADWVLLPAPAQDGRFSLQMTVADAGGPSESKSATWAMGGLLTAYSFPPPNVEAIDITATITDDDNKLTITQGQEVLTRAVTVKEDARTVRVEALVFASAPVGEVIRVGLFRSTATDSLAEARVAADGTLQSLPIDWQVANVIPGAVTYSLRIGATAGGKLNQDQAGGRKGGGAIAARMFVSQLRA